MTNNMETLTSLIKTSINERYKEIPPTEEQLYEEAEILRQALENLYPVSEEEFESIKQRLPEEIIHVIDEAETLRFNDGAHQKGWYLSGENDGYFWNRYKEYLINQRDVEYVNKLNKTTDDIMDDLGNPKRETPFQRRGLLLGDVQSGKTATYTAICNKAADAGYRVIIVLAGLMENLRIQTQERLDKEFVGLDSKYTLDNKADSSFKNRRVGVGRISPFRNDKFITRFTSVSTDFKTTVIQSNGLNLNSLNGTALFVVKKNKSVLDNLQKWLTKDEDLLNLPMLLIDDEADNASVNTKKINMSSDNETDRTAINNAINKILRSFRQASYLGITATPFANIFIDPSVDQDGAAKDLFPRHFLTLLPLSDKYIGADKIFGSGSLDNEWAERQQGEFSDSLIPIYNEEQDDYFAYKHKMSIADTLTDLPDSLYEAIYYFMLATVVTDLRFDNKSHRSMMVNVSRFTAVQSRVAELIEEFVDQVRSDIENYSNMPIKKASSIFNLKQLQNVWNKYGLNQKVKYSWETILKKYLLKSVKRIEIRAVNRTTGAKSLDYYNYENTGMRVIAVGGNSLSRGITLEGLCVSYFYRNTAMYDSLLQMGRWFGYRPNYRDIFKIWMGEDSIAWYGTITDAFNELKDELRVMSKQNLSPKDFGLKVRQNPGSLIVTARNKMRMGQKIPVPITVSGHLIETARLWNDIDITLENNNLCRQFIKKIDKMDGVSFEKDSYTHAYIWHDVPKKYVAETVRNFKSHPWNLNFHSIGLADLIEKDDDPVWNVAIPIVDKNKDIDYELDLEGRPVKVQNRSITKDNSISKMLKVNERHVRVGSGGCTKIGLERKDIEKVRKNKKATDKDYLLVSQKPIMLIHVLKNIGEPLVGFPECIYALGLGFPGGKEEKIATYVVNTKELENYIDVSDLEDEDDDV